MFLRKVMSSTTRQIRQIQQIKRISGTRLFSEMAETAPEIEQESQKIEKSMNQVTLLGRVGGEPQKRGNDNHPVVTFSVATHTNYKYDDGNVVQRTDWHKIVVFRPALRESVYRFMRKGQRVLVQGKLYYGEIKDENGKIRPTTSIIAEDVVMFQRKDEDVD
ncbi:single-stranded DNA-binding protein, mitochondrial [Leptopilina boulardi]|uniref:single-stranded DNA-binding protein, mitochondrial n=1 Tax=Leptopilina boulardi TaxID=63433 RepID=UPI0021F6542D|nr:single-stranded DNA-binding protein, mitochondrial [Leptopilina boulardi]